MALFLVLFVAFVVHAVIASVALFIVRALFSGESVRISRFFLAAAAISLIAMFFQFIFPFPIISYPFIVLGAVFAVPAITRMDYQSGFFVGLLYAVITFVLGLIFTFASLSSTSIP